eukprot:scaffold54331_cov70-Phaeocystis_antarctica.AAC.2
MVPRGTAIKIQVRVPAPSGANGIGWDGLRYSVAYSALPPERCRPLAARSKPGTTGTRRTRCGSSGRTRSVSDRNASSA